jgi:sulfur transfer complex TusBCD TusB component (DsrH family)
MYLRYQPDIAELQLSRIQASSAQTYKTGANHFKTFLVQQGVTMLDLLNSSPTDLHNVAACFVTYLSFLTARNTTTPIDSKVINGYLTHVVHLLINNGVIDSADQFRCPSTSRLVAAIATSGQCRTAPSAWTIGILILPVFKVVSILQLWSFLSQFLLRSLLLLSISDIFSAFALMTS